MRQFQFSAYDQGELVQCGEAFKKDILDNVDVFGVLYDSRIWTDYVLHWFACVAPLNVVTHAHEPRAAASWQTLVSGRDIARRMPGSRNASEFLLDLTHVEVLPMLVRTGQEQSPRVSSVRLGLESEWGHATSTACNIERVLYDASKLAAVRASAKVMIFGSINGDNHSDIAESLRRLRKASRDSAPWLWIDIPWNQDRRTGKWEPSFGVEP
ncbi:hypothetical protein WME97_30215 [Sorangium sp. So ce367]|uniref:hypothetical protein n=1 Tax=Sorangium sp. So ce367 TaxID=3133305 RepID=UPI003F5FCF4E